MVHRLHILELLGLPGSGTGGTAGGTAASGTAGRAAAGGVLPQRHGDGIALVADLVGLSDRQVTQGGGLVRQDGLEGLISAYAVKMIVNIRRPAVAAVERVQAVLEFFVQAGAAELPGDLTLLGVDQRDHCCRQTVALRAIPAGAGADGLLHLLCVRSNDAHIHIIRGSSQRGLGQQHAQHQEYSQGLCQFLFHVKPILSFPVETYTMLFLSFFHLRMHRPPGPPGSYLRRWLESMTP